VTRAGAAQASVLAQPANSIGVQRCDERWIVAVE
jgi:hypothetical protein